MPHDHANRPKRSRDSFKAAYQVFQEAIGEAPRTIPSPKKKTPRAKKPGLPNEKHSK